MATRIRGRIVTPDRVAVGTLCIEDDRIADVSLGPAEGPVDRDFGDALIVPGFIDVHLHGVGEFGMRKTDDLVGAAALQVKHGTTGFAPSNGCLPEDEYIQFGRDVREAQKRTGPESARILGAHFEGPFINPVRKGGMSLDNLRPASVEECRRYLDDVGDVLKLMTLSPELDGALEVIRLLREHGVVVSLGHSDATPEDLERAAAAGLNHVCHLFNTFDRTVAPRGGVWPSSLITAILANDDIHCEVICDMHHVPPDAVKITARVLAPDRFIAITDGMRGAGLPPGEYRMVDGRAYTTHSGVGKLVESDTIVGSVLTMNRAFANLVERADVDPVLAARFTSTNAARQMGAGDETGSIEPGKRADLAVLNGDYDCVATFVEGRLAHARES